jgi:hypothetical protein
MLRRLVLIAGLLLAALPAFAQAPPLDLPIYSRSTAPTLSLNFEPPATLDPRILFSRASVAEFAGLRRPR